MLFLCIWHPLWAKADKLTTFFCDLFFRYAGIEKGPATFGVIKRLRDNDMELHTNRQVSCNLGLIFCVPTHYILLIILGPHSILTNLEGSPNATEKNKFRANLHTSQYPKFFYLSLFSVICFDTVRWIRQMSTQNLSGLQTMYIICCCIKLYCTLRNVVTLYVGISRFDFFRCTPVDL